MRQVVTGLSPEPSGFISRIVLAGFVMDRFPGALGEVLIGLILIPLFKITKTNIIR
jgi:hypothetical protein